MRGLSFLLAPLLAVTGAACASPIDVALNDGSSGSNPNLADAIDAKFGAFSSCAPANDPTPTVDGKFTGWTNGAWQTAVHEYGAAAPVQGKFGWFYASVPNCQSFYLLNDWYERNDATICPAMYNLFRFSTGDGHQNWEVRVFGDGHLTILMNGKPYSDGKGGFSFGPSPNSDTPHTMFEFGVTGVETGRLACQLHDPASAASLHADDPGAIPGCGDPQAALVTEPTILTANLGPGVNPQLKPATAPTAVMLEPYDVPFGQPVTIYGGMFGTTKGTVEIGGVPQSVISWADGVIQVATSGGLHGEQRVVVYPGTGASNELWLRLADAPPCDDGVACTVDSVVSGGKCAHSPDHSLCDDGKACTVDTCTATGCATAAVSSPACPCAIAGAAWCPCKTAADCDSGYCVAGPASLLCAPACTGTCPDGWACQATSGAASLICAWKCVAKPESCNGLDDDCDGVTDNLASCNDQNACTTDGCTPETGACKHTPLGDGTVCDDGNGCTSQDACSAGACSGFAIACNDFNPCTSDTCSPTNGCVFTPLSGKPGGCDDNDLCTGDDSCVSGICKGTSTVPVAAVCQDTSCNAATGIITVKPTAQGTPCDDGNANTVCDQCTGDTGCVGAPLGTVCP